MGGVFDQCRVLYFRHYNNNHNMYHKHNTNIMFMIHIYSRWLFQYVQLDQLCIQNLYMY